jgi:hypothetical protein
VERVGVAEAGGDGGAGGAEAGVVELRQHVAGGPEASAMQPVWSPSGELYFLLEREGYWNLHRLRDGEEQIVGVLGLLPAGECVQLEDQ